MEKIVAMSFDIADQQVVTYNTLEWHNFIADAREQLVYESCDASEDYTLDELFEWLYGDEFWYEVLAVPFAPYAVAFDLASEMFVVAKSERDVEFYNEMAIDGGSEEEVFWAE